MSAPVHLVWFKRDLRVHDHAPLAAAAAAGRVLPLYIVEPDYWRLPDSAPRHWAFVRESLVELDAALTQIGARLVVREGEAADVLRDLLDRLPLAAVHSHQETGNAWTFARDRRVAGMLREHGVPWHEYRQHGVLRGLGSRDGWAAKWERMMRAAEVPAPGRLSPSIEFPPFDLAADDDAPGRQPGGRRAGLALLQSFFGPRGRHYRRAMATPNEAFDACSRLSPHLAWGTLSMREVNRRALAELDRGDLDPVQRASVVSFRSRLHWHCHFIQKLESEPAIETRHFH
ncbi:MAG: deoxyribodipyrimidine photo-lyase, partial [Pseudomonadota bacterium]